MRITKRQLQRIIKEEIQDILASDSASDVKAVEDAFAGGDNLINPVDHLKAQGIKETRVKSAHALREIITQELSRLRSR